MQQFDNLKRRYWEFVDIDPTRAVHYKTVMEQLALVQGQFSDRVMNVLDVGTGGGHAARIAVKTFNASVVGFDSSPSFIADAKEEEAKRPLGIEYHAVAAHEFKTDRMFDVAMSVLVLPYAPNAEYLTEFFRSASQTLPEGGKFASIVFNPDFTAFNERIGNRMFEKTEDGRVEVHFLDPVTFEKVFKEEKDRIFLTQFSHRQYEEGSKNGGFPTARWDTLHPSAEQIEQWGPEFWEKFEKEQPYALLVTEK